MNRNELSLQQRQAANKAFAESITEGGTATGDRLLFWEGFAAGIAYAEACVNEDNWTDEPEAMFNQHQQMKKAME